MRRRIRLTEGQLRNVVEEAARRVIQEMGAIKQGLNNTRPGGSGRQNQQQNQQKIDRRGYGPCQNKQYENPMVYMNPMNYARHQMYGPAPRVPYEYPRKLRK
jgi:hypothetical protein